MPHFQNRRRAFSNSEVRKSKDGNLTLIIRPRRNRHYAGWLSSSSFDSFDSILSNGTNTTSSSKEEQQHKRLKQNLHSSVSGIHKHPHPQSHPNQHQHQHQHHGHNHSHSQRLPRKLCVRQNTPTRDISIDIDAGVNNMNKTSFVNASTSIGLQHQNQHQHSPKMNSHNRNHCNLSIPVQDHARNIQVSNFKSRRRMTTGTANTITNTSRNMNTSGYNTNYSNAYDYDINVNHVTKGRFTRWIATIAVCCILFYTKTSHHGDLNRLDKSQTAEGLLSSRVIDVTDHLKKGHEEDNLKKESASIMEEHESKIEKELLGNSDQILNSIVSKPTKSYSSTGVASSKTPSLSSSSTTTTSAATSTKSTSTSPRKKLRQPQLAQANSLTTQSTSTTISTPTNSQIPQPLRKELLLTENEIKKIDSVLTDEVDRQSQRRSHSKYANAVNVGGLVLKPIHYFVALGCMSLMVIVVESYWRERRNCR